MRVHRQTEKATDAKVHVAIGGTALILRFITMKKGDMTIAVTVPGARALAQMLVAQADAADRLANEIGSTRRH